MSKTVFTNRQEAGQALAQQLRKFKDGVVVLALPRGGVETAAEVAHELDAPLDLIITRKVGHPYGPEYAIGAVTETGPAIWNQAEKIILDELWLEQAEAAERTEAKRRRHKYLAGHTRTSVKAKTAVLVDDGIATGLTMLAAIREVRKQKPAKIIVAVPVAPRDIIDKLLEEADEVVTLVDPDHFMGAVGAHYYNFPQLSDEDVIELLDNS